LSLIFLSLCSSNLLSAADSTFTSNILFAIADDWGFHANAYGTKWVNPTDFEKEPFD